MPFSRRSDDDFHPQSQSGFRQQIGDFLDFWDSDEFRMSPMVSPPMELSGGMDNDRGSESAETTTTRLATNAVSDRRLVRFSEDVSIICIPRRCDYPKDLRNLLFSNKKELSKNVARNLKEFASDGFDWRNVKEGENSTTMLIFDDTAGTSHSRSAKRPRNVYNSRRREDPPNSSCRNPIEKVASSSFCEQSP